MYSRYEFDAVEIAKKYAMYRIFIVAKNTINAYTFLRLRWQISANLLNKQLWSLCKEKRQPKKGLTHGKHLTESLLFHFQAKFPDRYKYTLFFYINIDISHDIF